MNVMIASCYFRDMANSLNSFFFLVCLLLIVLGINRGFDVSDEGFYVMLTVPQQENEFGIINYDLFFKLIFRLTGYSFSLVELRIIRLVGYFLAALALTKFVKTNFKSSLSKPQVFILLILGLFSGYAFLPPSLSYNSLTMVLSSFWICVIFSDLSTIRKSLFLGLILALSVYVKITVALALLLFFLGFFALKGKLSTKIVALHITPLLLFELVFWVFLQDFALMRLQKAIPFTSSRPGYGIIQLLKSPIIGLLFSFLGLMIGRLISNTRKKPFPILILVWIIAAGLFYWINTFTHITEEWNHSFLLVCAVFLGFFVFNSGRQRSFTIEEIVLFLLPFLLHLGSNVYWLRIGIHYWVFWLILILVYAPDYSKIFLNLIGMISMFLVFNGIWWHPFGHEKPLWSSKIDFYRGPEVIKIDKSQVELVEKIQQFAEARGVTQIQAAYRIPGLIWLAGYQIPHTANIWDKSQLQIIPSNPPKEMVYCENQSLPDSWEFDQSLPIGYMEGNPVYLLWN